MNRTFTWTAAPKTQITLTRTTETDGTHSLTTHRIAGNGRRTVVQRVTGKTAGKADALWLMHVAHWTRKYGLPKK
ncbi:MULTISPECIES: hypothetical protein [Streptomyces]|uniref:hypothetical protein n=1 Tax=Streptomyces TaxID=1883 RepID=UPI001603EABF|nr:hypothetical protein [Streptomyces murinus]MBA9050819.1 hypothetical protein [Streptomyces murinus]